MEKKDSEKQPKQKKQVEETVQATENVELTAAAPSEEKVDAGKVEENLDQQEMAAEEANQEQLSSLDLLWRLAYGELDEWAKAANYRDEVFLTEAKLFAEGIDRNQENMKQLSEKFIKEFSAWERTVRDEFLMSTTSLAHFFPMKSYQEINQQIDKIQERTLSILKTPCQNVMNHQAAERYFEMINQYIALRKKFRSQYLKTVKQAGNLIYENQKGLVNLFSRQIKTMMFPLNKYLEKSEELTKS